MRFLLNPIKIIILRLFINLIHKKIFKDIEKEKFEFITSNFYNNLSSLKIKELILTFKKNNKLISFRYFK